MTSIPIIGLNSNYYVPGTYMQVNYGAGGSSAGVDSPLAAILLGNALSTSPIVTGGYVDGYIFGPDVPGFLISVPEADVVAQAGSGSELHRGYRQFAKGNTQVPVYLLAVKESTGSAASLTVTIGGGASSAAAGNGYIRVYMEDDFVDVSVVAGDLLTAIATNVSNAVNSQADWAVTAAPSSATVVITAKQKGPRGNWIRLAVKVFQTGTATGATPVTSSASNFGYLAGGTVEDSWTNAAMTIDPQFYRYILPATMNNISSAVGIGLLSAQITTQALPLNDMRQRMITCSTDVTANALTYAKGLNNVRVEVLNQPNSNLTPFELICGAAGGYSLYEDQTVPVLNFDAMGVSSRLPGVFQVTGPFDGTKMSKADQQSCLISGVTPIGTSKNGQSYIVSRITSYSQNPVTSAFDPRVHDASIITVMDLAADRIQSALSLSFQNMQLADDPQTGTQAVGPNTITPNDVRSAVNKVLLDMAADGLLQKIQFTLAATQAVRDDTNDGRVGTLVQVYPVSLAHQFGVVLNQLSIV